MAGTPASWPPPFPRLPTRMLAVRDIIPADAAISLRYNPIMLVPDAEHAIIAPEKLTDYLLNPVHRRGAAKARLLLSLGYQRENPERLANDLRRDHLTQPIHGRSYNAYGECFEILAPIDTPSGRRVRFQSIWQIDHGTDRPRLITMYAR